MVLFCKTLDYNFIKDFIFDFDNAERFHDSYGYVYNCSRLLPPRLKGKLVQTIWSIMKMYCKRDDDCAADMQIIVRKDAWATSLMIIVRGCTKDLLELEPAVKTILFYAR